MSEEMNITETEPVELDTDIVLRKFVDAENGNAELDIRTPAIKRMRPVVQELVFPLYIGGEMVSAEKLAEYGLSIREYTRLEVDTATYGAYYANNPDLAPRVREYKNHLDRLGLAYTSTTDDISAAIQADETLSETEKLQLAQEIKAAFDNIALNLQALGIEAASFEAWRTMAKLIRFLPNEE